MESFFSVYTLIYLSILVLLVVLLIYFIKIRGRSNNSFAETGQEITTIELQGKPSSNSKTYSFFEKTGFVSAVSLLVTLFLFYVSYKTNFVFKQHINPTLMLIAGLCFWSVGISLAVTSFIGFTQSESFRVPNTNYCSKKDGRYDMANK